MTPDELCKTGSEHGHQKALFAWSNMAYQFGLKAADDKDSYIVRYYAARFLDKGELPIYELKWLHAIHNQGNASAIQGARAKAEGVKAGVWDIFLPVVVKGVYPGLYIEMKVKNNKLTKEQEQFKADNSHFMFAVCYSWQEARDAILRYLNV